LWSEYNSTAAVRQYYKYSNKSIGKFLLDKDKMAAALILEVKLISDNLFFLFFKSSPVYIYHLKSFLNNEQVLKSNLKRKIY
jgi:hypothetical protein